MSKADDQKVAPTEEQVKASNDAEKAKWEGDYKEEDLVVKYRKDEVEEPKEKVEEEVKDDAKGDEEPVVNYTEPEVNNVEDPGEFKPGDYSFEVVDKDGKSVTIKTPEEADKFADDDDNFKTAKALKDFLRKAQKMETGLEKDEKDYESKKKDFEDFKEAEQQRQETMNTLNAEFEYLVSKGQLPKVDPKYADEDWFDPEIAKQPGILERHQIADFMQKENEVRMKAGIRPMTSIIEGYNAWKLENADKVDERKAEGEARRQASSRVAGVSSTEQAPFVPKGIAVGNPGVFKRNQAVWDD